MTTSASRKTLIPSVTATTNGFSTPGGIKFHLLQTGWVKVKRSHYKQRGPAFSRLPSIVTDRKWSDWLPIYSFLIIHPEDGSILVDTGETSVIQTPEYLGGGGDQWFYMNQMDFDVSASDQIDAKLVAAGFDPSDIKKTVMTHLHSDHMGGMEFLPESRFYVSDRDAGGHMGTLRHQLPARSRIETVEYESGAFEGFGSSHSLTKDGSVRIVPTPGHTPGHQSVLLVDGDVKILFGGDAAFDTGQVEKGEIGGLCENIGAAKETLKTLDRLQKDEGHVLLFAHDLGNAARLEAFQAG